MTMRVKNGFMFLGMGLGLGLWITHAMAAAPVVVQTSKGAVYFVKGRGNTGPNSWPNTWPNTWGIVWGDAAVPKVQMEFPRSDRTWAGEGEMFLFQAPSAHGYQFKDTPSAFMHNIKEMNDVL